MPCSDYGTGRLAGLNVQVRYADGRPLGCRRADAVSSHVIVDAMPVAEFSQAAARAGFRDATAARQSRWESRDNQDENAPLPG